MTQETSPLFDTKTLARHRQRALAHDTGQWFLHDLAIAEVHERLADVNRRFTDPAVIGPRAAAWSNSLGLKADCVPDTDVLDLSPGRHDLIIHALSLHWANDPVGQLIQMRRALQPDGLMVAVLFAGETLTELRHALTRAEAEVADGISPRIAPMAELRALGGLLQRAGFALPVADLNTHQVSYETPKRLMHDLRAMGESNALEQRRRNFTPRAVFKRLDALHPQSGEGRITATFDLAYLTGWAPSETQQKPLRPGSAKMRLADVLGTTEHKPK